MGLKPRFWRTAAQRYNDLARDKDASDGTREVMIRFISKKSTKRNKHAQRHTQNPEEPTATRTEATLETRQLQPHAIPEDHTNPQSATDSSTHPKSTHQLKIPSLTPNPPFSTTPHPNPSQISMSASLAPSLGTLWRAGQISLPRALSRSKCSVITARTCDWKCNGPVVAPNKSAQP